MIVVLGLVNVKSLLIGAPLCSGISPSMCSGMLPTHMVLRAIVSQPYPLELAQSVRVCRTCCKVARPCLPAISGYNSPYNRI